MFKRRLIVSALMLALSGPALAGGSTGGATEMTQIMNNGELMASVSKQSQLVAGQIRDYANQVNQYTTMLQNLKNIPANVIAEKLEPYKGTLKDLNVLYKATEDVYITSKEAYTTLERRRAEMNELKMSPEEYLNAEMQLSKIKGGIYKAQADRDLAALKRAEEKSMKLASMAPQIDEVKGAVQGLQLLAQQNLAMAGELMEMNSQLREKSLQDKQAKEQSQALYYEKQQADLERMKAMEKQREVTMKTLSDGRYEVETKRKDLFKGL